MSWHADAQLVDRYLEGALGEPAAWSLESHVTDCDACRAHLHDQGGIDEARLQAVWSAVAVRVRAVERPWHERALVRFGMKEHDVRLLVATPSLTVSWLLGVAVVLALAVGAAWALPDRDSQATFAFLLLAPLLPVAGVAAAFGPRVDPAYELAVAAPMSSLRVLLLRAAAVLASSLALASVAALTLPGAGWVAAGWIVPALMLTAATLAASTRFALLPAAAAVASVWVGVTLGVEVHASAPLAAFGTVGQAISLILLAAAAVAFVTRRGCVETVVGP